MSKTAIAIFVKTPTLSPVKTRLAAGIGTAKALEFYGLCLKAVEACAARIDAHIIWAVGEKEGLSDPLWSGFTAVHTGEGGLGERQYHIYKALRTEYPNVLLIGADAPQLSPDILEQAIAALQTNEFVLGPARDGGYYLFGGRAPVSRSIWASVPWSTSQTRETLEAGLLPLKPAALPTLTDVDTQEDLKHAASEMPEEISAPQKRILDWIEKQP